MAHYFDSQPAAPEEAREIRFDYAGKAFVFYSSSGVFSKARLDEGSAALLDGLRKYFSEGAAPPEGRLLDLGCGYGVLGIVLKRLYPRLRLTLADINERALRLARENCRANRIGQTEIVAGDGWSALAGRRFDYVVTNPPIRAGKATVFAFLRGAAQQLDPGGTLACVLNKHQGAASAKKELERLFGHCEVVWRHKGFHVLVARRAAQAQSLPGG